MKDNVQQTQFSNPAKSSPDVKRIKTEKEPQRRNEKKQRRIKRCGMFFDVLHGLASLLFLVMLFLLDVLPFVYHVVIVGIVVCLWTITVVSQKGKRAGRVLGRIYSMLIVIGLLCGTFVVGLANHVLESVTDAPYESKKQEVDLMNMSLSASVTEDPIHLYVRDAGDDATVHSVSERNMLVAVNPNTRQRLCVGIPNEYNITIPNVTEGQREPFLNAGLYGVEAPVAALSSLYETEISYYLKMDFAWIDEIQQLARTSPAACIKMIAESLLYAERHIQTNISKYEVQQLIKAEIVSKENWSEKEIMATGSMTESYTFSSQEEPVPVMMPDQTSVDEIIDLINRVDEDEILEKEPEIPSIVIP